MFYHPKTNQRDFEYTSIKTFKEAEHKSQPLSILLYLFSFFHSSHRFSHFNHHGTFDSLTEDVTTEIVDSIDGAGCMQCVGRATATAVKLRPAILTFWL